MSTKQDVIDAIAEIVTAQASLDAGITNVRDAAAALAGTAVGNATVAAGGFSRGQLQATLEAQVRGLNTLSDAVAEKVAAADTVADALT